MSRITLYCVALYAVRFNCKLGDSRFVGGYRESARRYHSFCHHSNKSCERIYAIALSKITFINMQPQRSHLQVLHGNADMYKQLTLAPCIVSVES